MFNAMTACQALHPDPVEGEDEENADDYEEDAGGEEDTEGMFDDAEEGEDGDSHQNNGGNEPMES